MNTTILVTKLQQPPLRPRLVNRKRLTEQLTCGLVEGRRVTLISAPAGYGKTTVATAWLAELAVGKGSQPGASPWRAVWLALDEDDNDPVRFFSHLVAAFRHFGTDVGTATLDLLAAPRLPRAATLVAPLINDLAAQPHALILVLDDCHVLHAPLIHEALNFLCRHMPQGIHIVLLTRADPPLSLAALRARGEITELRAADLRFTTPETESFFAATLQQQMPADTLAALALRTEGWIAGLQLAGLSLRNCEPEEAAAFVAALGGSSRYIMDYLLEQVLSRLEPGVRTFLCQVAVLERTCAELCDAVTGRTDSHLLLAQLDQANLFLIPLDHTGKWWRFHHLFAELLRLELNAEEEAACRRRAAVWLRDHDLLSEAIHQALTACDFEFAVELIRCASGELLRTSEMRTLLNWLDRLPAALVQDDAELAVQRGLALFFTGEVARAAAAVSMLDGDGSILPAKTRGRLLTLQAWLAELHGQENLADVAKAAVEHSRGDDAFYHMAALLSLGHHHRAAGDSRAALQTFRTAVKIGETAGHSFAAVGGTLDLAFSLLDQGSRQEAEAVCTAVRRQFVDPRSRPLPVTELLDIPLAAIHYHGGELDVAQACALSGIRAARRLLAAEIMGGDAQRFLALVQFARGEIEASYATLHAAKLAAEAVNYRRAARVLNATFIDLHLRQGDLAPARRWVHAQGFRPDTPPSCANELEYCVYARWLRLEDRSEESWQAFTTVGEQARRDGRLGRLIGVLISQALAAESCGWHDRAQAHLTEAVTIAAPEGFRSQFLDAGSPVLPLLAAVQSASPTFVADLLARMSPHPPSAATCPPPPVRHDLANQTQVEPLTEREREVLALLAAGCSYREIAQRLIIAVGTVQAHCGSIYGKLGVNNRTQALLSARRLQLLP